MKWPLQDTYIGILTITLWHFLHYRYKPYLATPCETLHFALIHQPSIKRFGWKPCIKKKRAKANCKFDQDRFLYEKSSLF